MYIYISYGCARTFLNLDVACCVEHVAFTDHYTVFGPINLLEMILLTFILGIICFSFMFWIINEVLSNLFRIVIF